MPGGYLVRPTPNWMGQNDKPFAVCLIDQRLIRYACRFVSAVEKHTRHPPSSRITHSEVQSRAKLTEPKRREKGSEKFKKPMPLSRARWIQPKISSFSSQIRLARGLPDARFSNISVKDSSRQFWLPVRLEGSLIFLVPEVLRQER